MLPIEILLSSRHIDSVLDRFGSPLPCRVGLLRKVGVSPIPFIEDNEDHEKVEVLKNIQ